MNSALMLSAIETEMLGNLVKLLEAGKANDATWQMNKLQQLGRLQELNLNTIRKHREELLKAVRSEIEEEAFRRVFEIDDAADKAGRDITGALSPKADPHIVAVIDTWEKVAAKKFDQAFAPMLSKAQVIYTDTIYKAVAKQQMGMSGRQAIAEACREWSQQGLKALTDSAGRNWTTEAYAQTVVRSNSVLAATETQFKRMEELGGDLVEISSHLGARPKCEPYQGKIYSLSGKSKNYPPLSSTSYGEPDGLFGINCRHVMYPYYPGTEKTYHPQNEERNETAYKNSQRQRGIERAIREGKRNLDIAEKTGDKKFIQEAGNLLERRERAMQSFISETGRTRRYDREEIYL
jgi:hypothetical protein